MTEEQVAKITPIELSQPPDYPLNELFPEAVRNRWRTVRNPTDQLRFRLEVLEFDSSYPSWMQGRRAQKAAWDTYLSAAFSCGMFHNEKGADIKGRLRGIDDDGFRSAMSECLVSWFLSGVLNLPINPQAPGRGDRVLEMTLIDGAQDIGVEVKAPFRPWVDIGWGDDSDAVQSAVERAQEQFGKERPNLLILVPSGRMQFTGRRTPLMRALYGQSVITFKVDRKTGAAVSEPKTVFSPDGQFFNNRRKGGRLIKPDTGMPKFQRVSALMCLEEYLKEVDTPVGYRAWIEHNAVILHNPFAYHPIQPDLFKRYPQCLKREGKMEWTDGYSTVV